VWARIAFFEQIEQRIETICARRTAGAGDLASPFVGHWADRRGKTTGGAGFIGPTQSAAYPAALAPRWADLGVDTCQAAGLVDGGRFHSVWMEFDDERCGPAVLCRVAG